MISDLGHRTTVFVHYYRAMVGRADTWRMRMDTTTNWAVFTTGTLLSFLFTQREHDYHIVGIMGIALVFFMLCYEARRCPGLDDVREMHSP